jgi:hypothetical protein
VLASCVHVNENFGAKKGREFVVDLSNKVD